VFVDPGNVNRNLGIIMRAGIKEGTHQVQVKERMVSCSFWAGFSHFTPNRRSL
jgi:hypothetical protein